MPLFSYGSQQSMTKDDKNPFEVLKGLPYVRFIDIHKNMQTLNFVVLKLISLHELKFLLFQIPRKNVDILSMRVTFKLHNCRKQIQIFKK